MKTKTKSLARMAIFGTSFALSATCVMAQTVGEILDKGGQRLDAAATRAIVSGVTLSGTNAAGFVGTSVYKTDGTLFSTGTRPRDNFTNSGTGTWSVDDSGKVCSKIQWNGGGSGGGCHFWFKQGDEYFTAQTEAREQAAIRRQVGK